MNASERTRIKICGITRLEDAEVVADSGADALGLNFSELSARQVAPEVAAEIATAMRDRLLRVGLFVDHSPAAVRGVLARVELDILQFHGNETGAFCRSFGLPYMKVHRVADSLNIDALTGEYPDACCLLLDAYVAGQPGGTGQLFDWGLWPNGCSVPLVLAGGLTPDNVALAIRRTRPYAVDVSGGVEAGHKGIKDPTAIRRFVGAVREADAEQPDPGDRAQ